MNGLPDSPSIGGPEFILRPFPLPKEPTAKCNTTPNPQL
jgi:hypothetical protein